MLRKIALTSLLAAALVLLGAGGRMVNYSPNFAPAAAAILFAGYLMGPVTGVAVGLSIMFISDLWIGAYDPRIMAVNYLAIALPAVVARRAIGQKLVAWRIAALTVGASLWFFLMSNGAVWVFDTLYPHTLAGLWKCYTLAIPFYRNTLAGDVMWSAILFGGYAAFLYVRVGAGTRALALVRRGQIGESSAARGA